MKKANLFCLSLPLMVAVMFTGCEEDSSTENSAIKVESSSALTQNVFADETQGKGGVTFTTADAWTSSITEKTAAPAQSSSLKSAQAVSWISIDPSSGDKAGDYTVTISLETNLTGADRTAIVTIICGDSEITITVTQKATKEDGTAPAPLTQQQIIDLLKNAWVNTKASPKIAVSVTNAALAYPMIFETNQVQKKSLSATVNDAIFSEFEYIDNLTKYVYENGTKYREELSSDFWNDYANINEMFNDGGFVPENYFWTARGKVYAGVTQDMDPIDVTIELTADNKIKTLHIVDVDDGVVDDDVRATFSYTSVNPAFPAGFDKADFLLKGSEQYGGTGTFTNTMAADQPLAVDGAKYLISQIRFYKEGADMVGALYLDIHFPGQAAGVPLPAGIYHFENYGQSIQEYGFYCQKGVLGGMVYYGKGGTVTVSIDGDIYTINVDMDTYHEYSDSTTGKIRGAYTGYLPAEQW
ncbi:MAG: BACON domain-containing protein [Prevotellaceae bacterium]|jgi:hypothetical protein|nr:BACON domain-containing protein [Prevotellaceae bacterium]